MYRAISLIFLAMFSAAASAQGTSDTPPLRVVASFTILADWVRIVGGDQVAVHTLVGPDADAHVYEPTPADLKLVAQANVIVLNGLGFEGWMDRLAQAAQFRGRTIQATSGVVPRHAGRSIDPHAWQDLRNARTYVLNIATGLAAARPANASSFATRATSYLRQIDDLEADCRREFAAIPRERRVVVTSHDAFGYLADAYGLTLLPAQGLSTEMEPNASAIGELIRQIRTHRVQAVFVENIRDPRFTERIAAEGGVVVGGRLYSDALGAAGSPADNFLAMYRHNVNTLVSALRRSANRPAPGVRP